MYGVESQPLDFDLRKWNFAYKSVSTTGFPLDLHILSFIFIFFLFNSFINYFLFEKFVRFHYYDRKLIIEYGHCD